MGKFTGTSSWQQTPTCSSKNVTHNWDAKAAHPLSGLMRIRTLFVVPFSQKRFFCGIASNTKHPALVTAVKSEQRYSLLFLVPNFWGFQISVAEYSRQIVTDVSNDFGSIETSVNRASFISYMPCAFIFFLLCLLFSLSLFLHCRFILLFSFVPLIKNDGTSTEPPVPSCTQHNQCRTSTWLYALFSATVRYENSTSDSPIRSVALEGWAL
jgi:hypothetical protein